MYKFDFALILTCTINPVDIPNLVRKDPKIRFEDYKKSFNFWIKQPEVKKIIFIENSNYDITYFKNLSKAVDKKIEKNPAIFTEWFKIYMQEHSMEILG